MLRIAAAAGTAAAIGVTGSIASGTAGATTTEGSRTGGLPYPAGVTDTSHCTPEVAAVFRRLFTAKSKHDAAGFLSFFSKAHTSYIDASLGVAMRSWKEMNDFFTPFLSTVPADALSYPLRIVGDERSAVVEFVDTPTFFGKEIAALSSVTFDSKRKITRWIDYWDGRSSLWPNTIPSTYPTDFSDSEQNVNHAVVRVARELQAAFAAGDGAAAAALMSPDVVVEDVATHTRLRSAIQAQRYYTRALGRLPYGPGAAAVHAAGGRRGGGYEWSAGSQAAPLQRGHTGFELDAAGKISRLTTVYDSSVLSDAAYQSLVGLAAEAPLS